MAKVPTSYFVVQSKLKPIMDAIQKAGVPEKFTLSFLNSLGFKSTNDRPIVAVLKSLGFLDQNAVPTAAYREYKDASKSRLVLGNKVKEAYSDVFLANEKANSLSTDDLKGIFASLTGKSDSVAAKMAGTFKALCSISDFSGSFAELVEESIHSDDNEPAATKPINLPRKQSGETGSPEFHYNIQIHLPITRDISVYNAIFKSLREHLL